MNIYFSCSITGGRNEERIYQQMVKTLLDWGHEVPTAHLSSPEVMELEKVVDPWEVYERDMRWLENADAVVAEVSTPSHGVGYEIACALNLQKPVLCCYQSGKRISKILSGNSSKTLTLAEYSSTPEMIEILQKFVAGINAPMTQDH